MRKFVMAALGGTLAGALATTQIAGPLLAQEAAKTSNVYEQLDLFGDVFERIRAQYVEEVDARKLIEAAINGMLTSLDPHSSYLSPQDAAQMRIQTRGEFGGLGITVTQEEGFVKVISPMDGTPAAEAGIESGDFITHVDGESVLGLNLDQAVELMRGPVGSEIIITVVREGEAEPFDVPMIRDTIKLTAVRSRTEGESVVLRITTFNDQTYENLESGMKEQIEAAGGIDAVNGFVIDLRNNPGGLLTPAIGCVSRCRRNRQYSRPQCTRWRTFQRNAWRSGPRQTDSRFDQRWVCFGVRNRGRGVAGSSPRGGRRHQEFRERVCSDRYAPAQRRLDEGDDSSLLHTVRPFHPGIGRIAEYHCGAAAP
jgi:C-terminal processing protease CtpA/Prc